MSDELPLLTPANTHRPEIQLTSEKQTATQPAPDQLSPEQIRALDEAFKAPPQGDLAAGLLMLWASTPVLVELAHEHLKKDPAGEDEAPPEP